MLSNFEYMNLFILLNPVGLFRTVLFIALIYIIIRTFTRYILPIIMENKIKDIRKKMEEEQRMQQQSGKREGDVTIEYKNRENFKKSNEEEYIDFEEID